jgi:hypothetical protein
MGQHSAPAQSSVTVGRTLTVAAGVAALAGGFAAPASAAPPVSAKAGHLVLTTADGTQTLPPGQAKKRALAACGDAAPDSLDIDAVRDVFPDELDVCAGVSLRSQVAPDVDDDVEDGDAAAS